MTRVVSRRGRGRRLQRDFRQHAERTERTGHQARHVESGHVLDHLAAELQRFAGAVDDANAEHEVAHGACLRAPRTRKPGGDDPAERRSPTVTRRFEREHLIVLRECRFDLVERRARARGDDELARRISNDARERRNVDDITVKCTAVEILRATAANSQRAPVGCRCADALAYRRKCRMFRAAGHDDWDRPSAAAILSRYKRRGSSASMIVVSASAARCHSCMNGCASSVSR